MYATPQEVKRCQNVTSRILTSCNSLDMVDPSIEAHVYSTQLGYYTFVDFL